MPVVEIIKLLIKLGPAAFQAYVTISKIVDELRGTGLEATAEVAASKAAEALRQPKRRERKRRLMAQCDDLRRDLTERTVIAHMEEHRSYMASQRPPSEGET